MTATAVSEYRTALRVIPVITNDLEHDAVLAEIDALMDHEPNRDSPNGVRLRLLARIAAEFEREHYSIEPLSPPETIAYAMERHGITRVQIGEIVGGASRVADLLNARRRIRDVDQLRALAALLRVPFDLLTVPYATTEPKSRSVAPAKSAATVVKKRSLGQRSAIKKAGEEKVTGIRRSGGTTGAMRLAASARRTKTTKA
ncbi:helix-turn-helix domain-containing protein [Muricoccus nepalensis]|uniref:helix-turn-helix domain-containing protein n=1 Tax=Muricoccus nepalensis TaxID=1854500 RepID=UPI001127BC8B|nr:hypothetical protein [Roseomonas nepalensis]